MLNDCSIRAFTRNCHDGSDKLLYGHLCFVCFEHYAANNMVEKIHKVMEDYGLEKKNLLSVVMLVFPWIDALLLTRSAAFCQKLS